MSDDVILQASLKIPQTKKGEKRHHPQEEAYEDTVLSKKATDDTKRVKMSSTATKRDTRTDVSPTSSLEKNEKSYTTGNPKPLESTVKEPNASKPSKDVTKEDAKLEKFCDKAKDAFRSAKCTKENRNCECCQNIIFGFID